ncbi:MAG TPA: GntR family transcriptional regulator [Candidatus Limnocylindrales bacterium]|nr:GntR family transcriptional regulator [Candidatus Limnocylindrales bacterium]
MIPFRIRFRPGVPLYEQVVYAATKAVISGRIRPGDPFPSVRNLSKDLKINPNTAHKVVSSLLSSGLLETRPGVGTVVAVIPAATASQRTALLGDEIEELVVEAKRLGIEFNDLLASVSDHWKRLSKNSPNTESERGGRKR